MNDGPSGERVPAQLHPYLSSTFRHLSGMLHVCVACLRGAESKLATPESLAYPGTRNNLNSVRPEVSQGLAGPGGPKT